MQHNCYNCKHRTKVPGSAHSSCNSVENQLDAAVFTMMGMNKYLTLNQHGVKNGWAFWPVDFDPCWVDHCNFYESNETK